jgi:hypothetical protein
VNLFDHQKFSPIFHNFCASDGSEVVFSKKGKQEKVDKIFTGDKKAQKMS